MRIRASHVATLVLAIVVGLVVLVIWRDRNVVGDGIETAVEDARLPGAGEDMENVPFIELETYHVNLGTIANTGFSFGEVKIFNKGKAELRIKDVQTTCACTVGAVKKEYNPIPPGGEGILSIRIDPRRIPGFHSLKTLTIQSNDAAHPNVKLEVECDVDPEYELIPPELDMGDMVKGDDSRATLILRQLRDEPINITEVREHIAKEMPQEDVFINFSFELLPEDKWTRPGKQEYLITATQGELCPAGPFERRFRIYSSIDRAEQFIPVRGNVTAPYTINTRTPGILFLMAPKEGGPPEGHSLITSESNFEVTEITTDLSQLETTVDQEGPSRKATIHVRTAPGATPGQLLAFIYFTIHLDGKDYRERFVVRGVVS